MLSHHIQTSTRVGGARSDSLLGYLKALAVLRLVSKQLDSQVRGSWESSTFVLHGLDRDGLIPFFINEYRPTPILNPWNNGSGFSAKSKLKDAGQSIDRAIGQLSPRWQAYVQTYAEMKRTIDAMPSDAEKRDVLLALRERVSDEGLEWLDAAVLIGNEELAFPSILGSGGNDGNLEFSVHFAKRALDVIGDEALPNARTLLEDAIDGTALTPLSSGILGQFALGAGSNVNPWDYVFAMEGAIAFSGSITRRYSSGSDKPSIPFQFESVAVGYAAASDGETDRGEIWLPQWKGRATYSAIRSLLRNGRVELLSGARTNSVVTASNAADSIAAIQAAQTLGVSSGIESFGRIVIAQRNGLAFGATYVGRIEVADRSGMAALSREARTWVKRVGYMKELGAKARASLRSYNEGIIAYAGRPSLEAFQSVLAALGEIDDAVAFARKTEIGPLPWLSNQLHRDIDGMIDAGKRNVEHRIARAVTSIGHEQRQNRIRYRISHIVHDARKGDRYDASTRVTWLHDIRDTFVALFRRAALDAAVKPTLSETGFAAQFSGSFGLISGDLADIFSERVDWERVKILVRAYAIIEPYRSKKPASQNDYVAAKDLMDVRPPVSFAALKTLVHGYVPSVGGVEQGPGYATFVDSETAFQLCAGTEALRCRALQGAFRRLRSAGADVRDFSAARIEQDLVSTFIAALFVPVHRRTRDALHRDCMLARESTESFASTTPATEGNQE